MERRKPNALLGLEERINYIRRVGENVLPAVIRWSAGEGGPPDPEAAAITAFKYGEASYNELERRFNEAVKEAEEAMIIQVPEPGIVKP